MHVSTRSNAYRILNPTESPPGGWLWKHDDSGTILTSDGAFSELLARVEAYLLTRHEDPAPAAAEIHHCTARRLIASGRSDLVETVGPVRRTREHYSSGAKAALLQWWKESPLIGLLRGKVDRGEPVFVGQDEADRRAAICAKCPHNVIPASKTWAQQWTDGRMLNAVEGRRTRFHDQLGACDVCSCELRAAVWWLPDILVASMKRARFVKQFPDFCWKKHLNESEPPNLP